LDQRRAIVAAKHCHRVGDQHRFSDDERRGRSQHEAGEGNRVVGENQVRRQHNQVEADKKKDCRRQHFTEFAQKEGACPMHKPGGCIGGCCCGLEFRGLTIVQNSRAPHSLSPADITPLHR
jgi:hypothetical protein